MLFGSTLTNPLQTVDRFKIRSPGSISGVHRELLPASVIYWHVQKGDLTRIFHAPEGFIGKAFKGAAVVNLLQSLDNEADEGLRERPPGEFFSVFFKKIMGCILYNRFYADISVQPYEITQIYSYVEMDNLSAISLLCNR